MVLSLPTIYYAITCYNRVKACIHWSASVSDMNFRLVVSIYMYKTASTLYLKGQFTSYSRTVYPVDVGFH